MKHNLMKKSITIFTMLAIVFGSFSGLTFAQEPNLIYTDDTYGYTFTAPSNWTQISDDVMSAQFPNYEYKVVGFKLDGRIDFTPNMYIIHDKKDGNIYKTIEELLNNYVIDPTGAELELKEVIKDNYSGELVSIDSIVFDTKKHIVYQYKTVTDGTKDITQVTINLLTKQSALIFNIFLDPKDGKEFNQSIIDNMINSLQYEAYQVSDNKIIVMKTAKGFDKTINQPINPTSAFHRRNDNLIYSYVEFYSLTTEDVVISWYYYQNGKRILFQTFTRPKGYNIYFTNMYKTGGTFFSGKWDIEVISGDIKETISFMATDSTVKPINLHINGIQKVFDTNPVSINGRTLVPLRGIFEALGATIKWDSATQTVTAVKGNTTITLKLGDQYATINGKKVPLDIKAQSINSRTMVPLRFVGEALGAQVNWDGTTQSVIITSK